MSRVSQRIDRLEVVFDDESLVADGGLLAAGTLMDRLGLEELWDEMLRLGNRVGGANPGRKVLSLVAAMLVGGTHLDHADRLRAGATSGVLPHRVMAPSTLGTFLRSFGRDDIGRLDEALDETLRRVWAAGAGPGEAGVTIDVDSTVCEGCGKAKEGAGFGHTKVLSYHPLLATRAESGEVVAARLRVGGSQRGNVSFVAEAVGRVRGAGASGRITLRADSGFYSHNMFATLNKLGVDYSITVPLLDQRACRDRGHRGEGLDLYQIPQRWRSPSRGDHHLGNTSHQAQTADKTPSRRAPHPHHRPRPAVCAVSA